MSKLIYTVFEWDWKDQPDWDEIGNYIRTNRFIPYFHEVETGSDSYAVMVASEDLTTDLVKHYYKIYCKNQ